MSNKKTIYLYSAVFLLVSIAISLLLKLDWSQAGLVLRELRFPRMVAAVAIGSALAISGVVLQTVLSNPLSEPYTLGVASGAALGAAMTHSMNERLSFFGLNGGAVLGAIAVLFLLLKLVRKSGQGSESMILMGIMLSLFGSSLLSVWMALANPVGVQSVTFWLLGDLSRVELRTAFAILVCSVMAGGFFWMIHQKLDAFLFGESWVDSFGVSYAKTQMNAIIVISILIGFCVSAAGMIGFVGLMVPHWARRGVGPRHKDLIPLSGILGAGTLALSDGLARGIGDPHELPVGAVTALFGAPLFIFLLMKYKRTYFGSGGVQ